MMNARPSLWTLSPGFDSEVRTDQYTLRFPLVYFGKHKALCEGEKHTAASVRAILDDLSNLPDILLVVNRVYLQKGNHYVVYHADVTLTCTDEKIQMLGLYQDFKIVDHP
jgi:hypothetical protein